MSCGRFGSQRGMSCPSFASGWRIAVLSATAGLNFTLQAPRSGRGTIVSLALASASRLALSKASILVRAAVISSWLATGPEGTLDPDEHPPFDDCAIPAMMNAIGIAIK